MDLRVVNPHVILNEMLCAIFVPVYHELVVFNSLPKYGPIAYDEASTYIRILCRNYDLPVS